MADKGIIFSAAMVRALLSGRKTQTRRLLKPAPAVFPIDDDGTLCDVGYLHVEGEDRPRLYTGGCLTTQKAVFASGDRLYVREAWRPHYLGDGIWDLDVSYSADGARRTIKDGDFGERDWTWPKAADRGNVPSIHMPRWASRLWLLVTDVRVQRLQEISEEDAWAEGLEPHPRGGGGAYIMVGDLQIGSTTAVGCYSELWRTLHKPGERWRDNPWIVAVTFDVHHGNIDEVPA